VGRDEVLARVERMRPALLVWMVRQCGSFADAQDLVGEVMAIAVAAEALPSSPTELRAWLIGRAETVARRERRRRARQARVLGQAMSLDERLSSAAPSSLLVLGDTIADDERPLEELCGAQEICRRVLRQLEAWPAGERELLLQVAAGGTYAVVGRQCGLSRFAVRRRVLHLRRRLLAELDAETAAEVKALLGPSTRP